LKIIFILITIRVAPPVARKFLRGKKGGFSRKNLFSKYGLRTIKSPIKINSRASQKILPRRKKNIILLSRRISRAFRGATTLVIIKVTKWSRMKFINKP